MQSATRLTYKWARRIAVAVVGGTTVLLGVLLLATPGPGLVVIPVGLAILGLEFAWARRWLRRMRDEGRSALESLRNGVGLGEGESDDEGPGRPRPS